jgi:MA3 domain.
VIFRQALARADTLLSMKHGLVRLDNVWGVGGGLRPVKYLTRQMTLLLQEYLSSGDLQEATRCLMDLEVPHFHHELVYEVLKLCFYVMFIKRYFVSLCKCVEFC